MARYLQVADQARETINKIVDIVSTKLTDEEQKELICVLGHLYNLGIRTSPRAVQSTVRFRAVSEAVRNQPVLCSMREEVDERSGRTYNKLSITPQ